MYVAICYILYRNSNHSVQIADVPEIIGILLIIQIRKIPGIIQGRLIGRVKTARAAIVTDNAKYMNLLLK